MDYDRFPLIYPVACHTDNIGPGSTFVAISGKNYNGASFISLALSKGASKIVIEKSEFDLSIETNVLKHNAKLILVDNSRRALAQLSAKALNYPSRSLKIIGVTGTKGKSTTVFLLEHFLKSAGYKTALVSTIKNKIGKKKYDKVLTTPQPDYLNIFFDLCKKEKVDYVVLEVAAQALVLDRVYGVNFDAAIFTNFSQEHAEFFKTQEDYFNAKSKLFEQLKKNAPAILNADDKAVLELNKKLNKFISFGFSLSADFKIKLNSLSLEKSNFNIVLNNSSKNNEINLISSTLTGLHNIYNIVAAASCANSLGVSFENIKRALDNFSFVPGRLQRFKLPNGATAFIDYAHNASSFEAVLSMLKNFCSKLIVVFGCGGERDSTKRPLMGSIASKYCDKIFLTTDNPRSEDPSVIVQNILDGIDQKYKEKVEIEINRELAIEKAYLASDSNSIIALLGKGPDEYQIIRNEKKYFSEAKILSNLQLAQFEK